MNEIIQITQLSDFKTLEKQLIERWLDLERNCNAFRYKLNIQKQKILDGNVHFLVQLNTERSTMRRKPQTITSIVQPFDGKLFNFTNVNECEVIVRCRIQLDNSMNESKDEAENKSKDAITTFLVNNSPLTKYHSLICPRLTDGLSQVITNECIELAIDIMSGFNDRCYRIGYNSLGALASVNHLHLHLMHIPEKLFLEEVQITAISDGVYRMDFPSFALCMPVFKWSEKGVVAAKLMKIIDYLYKESIPHNIFWTFGTQSGQSVVNIFVFPRSTLSNKPESAFNVAFCELSGYFPVGDADLYDRLTEKFLIGKISEVIGHVHRDKIVADVMATISNLNSNPISIGVH